MTTQQKCWDCGKQGATQPFLYKHHQAYFCNSDHQLNWHYEMAGPLLDSEGRLLDMGKVKISAKNKQRAKKGARIVQKHVKRAYQKSKKSRSRSSGSSSSSSSSGSSSDDNVNTTTPSSTTTTNTTAKPMPANEPTQALSGSETSTSSGSYYSSSGEV